MPCRCRLRVLIVKRRFLLAPLHIGALAEEPTAGHLELALQKLPSGLDETYEGAFARIEKQGVGFQALARRILSWVIYARRHLSATELQLALAIEPGKSKLDEKFIPDIEIIGSICAGLITFDKKCDVVRLVHHTTQEYCKRTLTRWLPHGAADITKACLTYLCFDRFSSGPCLRGSEYRERLALNKLYHYAAQNWGHHARYDSNSCPEVIDFLERQGCLEASTQTLFSGEALAPESGYHWEEVTHRFPRGFTGLHMAAYFGIEKVVESLLQKGANTGAITNTDSADSHNCSPLFWAAERGHANVVELLLKTGKVNANSKGEYSWTPLHWASAKGYKTIVKLLLENGKVDPDSKDEDSQTPLSWAAKKGHETIVELLLETGNVDVDSKDKDNQTPLSRAAKSGHESVVKLLLNTEKVDVDSRDGYGQTPLSWAAEKGHETVVKLLLETGKVDADSKDNLSWTPFSYASRGGHTAVVKLLLETEKVDINSQGRNSRTSLSWAAEKGHEAVVSLLLTEKVDVDLGDKYGRTPLSYAAKGGHTAVVKLLLETGNVHTDSMSKDSQTRLSLASAKGYKDVVRLLSNKGADLDVTKTTG